MEQLNVAQFGRVIGATIIVVGTILAIWNTADFNLVGADENIRFFLSQALNWLAFGALVYIGAEILDQVTGRQRDDGPE